MIMRTCKMCNEEKSIDNFGIRRNNGKHYWQCNTCKQKVATQWNKVNSIKRLAITGAYRAKKHNIPFEIDADWILANVKEICPCCNEPYKLGPSEGRGLIVSHRPSVDRFDPKQGYTPENARIICTRCNIIKNVGSIKDHENILTWLKAGGPR